MRAADAATLMLLWESFHHFAFCRSEVRNHVLLPSLQFFAMFPFENVWYELKRSSLVNTPKTTRK